VHDFFLRDACRAVVLIYNLEPQFYGQLLLTREQIADIYSGRIRYWSDPSILALNSKLMVPPNAKIKVAARSDYSGTTYLLTGALSSFDSTWNATYGQFAEGLRQDDQPYWWNESVISLWGRSSSGMIGVVYSYHYSIGYVSAAAAIAGNFSYVHIVNKAGQQS
jgi:ABC-type phosphate transport system substrate-binding protein